MQVLHLQVSRVLVIVLLLIISVNLEGNESEESGDDAHHHIASAADDIDAENAPNSPVSGRPDQEEAAKGRSACFLIYFERNLSQFSLPSSLRILPHMRTRHGLIHSRIPRMLRSSMEEWGIMVNRNTMHAFLNSCRMH